MNSKPLIDLGNRIRELRESRDWSQGELARRINVSRPTVSQWESGNTKNLRNNNLLALAKAFHTSIEELLTGEQQNKISEQKEPYALTQEELKLIEKYRDLASDEDRRKIQAIVTAIKPGKITKNTG